MAWQSGFAPGANRREWRCQSGRLSLSFACGIRALRMPPKPSHAGISAPDSRLAHPPRSSMAAHASVSPTLPERKDRLGQRLPRRLAFPP